MSQQGQNFIEKKGPNGEYIIYVSHGDLWKEVAELSFNEFFQEREIDLSAYLSEEKYVKTRLVQKGGGAAHIDSVFLGGKILSGVKGIEDSLALKKLSKKDFDVIDAFGKDIEITFPADGKDSILS